MLTDSKMRIYEEILNSIKYEFINAYNLKCNEVCNYDKMIISFIPNNSKKLVDEAYRVENILETLNNMQIPSVSTVNELMMLIEDKKNILKETYETEICNLNKLILDKEVEVEKTFINEINTINLELQDSISKYKNYLKPLYNSIETLISQKPKLEKFAMIAGINLYTTSVNLQNLTMNDMRVLCDLCNKVIEEIINGRKGILSITKILYFPLCYVIDKEDKEIQTIFSVIYGLIILAVIIFTNPYGMGIVGLFVIIQALVGSFNSIIYEKYLSTAYYITCNPSELEKIISDRIIEEDEVKKIKDKLSLQKNINIQDKKLKATAETREKLENLLNSNPLNELEEVLDTAKKAGFINEILNELKEVYDVKSKELDIQKQRFKNYFKNIVDKIYYYKSKLIAPGESIFSHSYMNLKYKMGAIYYKEDAIDYYIVDIPHDNILFEYRNKAHRTDLINVIKLMLCNAIASVKERMLYITILDNKNLGGEFSEFFSATTSDYIQIVTKDISRKIEEIFQGSKKNITTLKSQDINSYNKDNEKIGKVTLEYNLIIILADESHKLWNDINLNAFKEYSFINGYWIWLLHPSKKLLIKDNKYPDNYRQIYKFSVVVRDIDKFILGDKFIYISDCENGIQNIKYTNALGERAINTFEKNLESSKISILDYETKYRQVYIPDEKVWTFNTLKGIELRFGFLDGDPSKPNAELLGDDAVNALMVGVTGAGKSATINQTLASLLRMYSPEWLQLVMVDFKNVEFGMYADSETNISMIPHTRILAGTEDGEYALSIFEYLMSEMNLRKELLSKYKFQKIEEYNTVIMDRRSGDPQKIKKWKNCSLPLDAQIIPRMLVLIDEFQVMFVSVSPKILTKINSLLTNLSKLIRFCGCHFWFTSQSMKNTMSSDVLEQFKLRCALQLTKETSEAVFLNAAPSTLKGKGWIYTNSKFGDERYNHLYRVPFASNTYIKEYIQSLNKLCKEKNLKHNRAYMYNEKLLYGIDVLKNHLQSKQVRDEKDLFILGERTLYSRNKIPNNFKLLKDNRENILIVAQDRKTRCNLLNTLLINIEDKKMGKIFAHSSDKDISSLLNLNDKVEKGLNSYILHSDTKDILQKIESIISERESNPDANWCSIYFFCIDYDSITGVGRGEDGKTVRILSDILQRGSLVKVHVIMTISIVKTMPNIFHFFGHYIVSQVDTNSSFKILEHDYASLLKDGISIYKSRNIETKFKIYQSDFDETKIQSRELYYE